MIQRLKMNTFRPSSLICFAALTAAAVFACAPAEARILKYIAVGVSVHAIDRQIDSHTQAARAPNHALAASQDTLQTPVKQHWMTDEQRKAFFNRQ